MIHITLNFVLYILIFCIVFINSDSCFYIECVADPRNVVSKQSTSSFVTEPSGSKKKKIEFNSSKVKPLKCSFKSLDNIDAALTSAEKLITQQNYTSNRLKTTKVSEMDIDKDIADDDKILKNENKSLKLPMWGNSSAENCEIPKNTLRSSTPSINSTSSPMHSFDQNLRIFSENDNHNSLELELDNGDISFPSTLDGEEFETIPDDIYTDDRIKDFILEGGMIDDDNTEEAYNPSEIDRIIDDKIICGIRLYLVKWNKWSRGFNTWERFSSLYKSQKLVYEFFCEKKKNSNHNSGKVIHPMLSRNTITHLFELFRSETGLSLPIVDPEDMCNILNSIDIGSMPNQIARKKSLKFTLATSALTNFRQQQLAMLKNWEYDINTVTKSFTIKVENNIDLEGPPDSFVYINKYLPNGDVTIPDDPPIGCACKKNCQSSVECCNEISGYPTAYDSNKNIIVDVGTPIFECNKKCKCTSECKNRVVQLGSKINVCIYKTRNCGWGVKTNQNIKKGQFLAEFVGEVITVKESEFRLENNYSVSDYMWNLDFDDSYFYKYIIDGTHYANYTYFINHSCEPNLNVYAVWINCLDRNLPQLALFASRDILVGERLTTNYFSRSSNNTTKTSGVKCQCEMKNCRNYYF